METFTTSNDNIKLITINGKVINRFANKRINTFNNIAASSVTLLQRLTTPEISITGTILYVTNYIDNTTVNIYVNNALKASKISSEIDLSEIITSEGDYNIKVIIAKESYISSLFSNELTYSTGRLKLATPENVTALGSIISYNPVDNATMYKIYADGAFIGGINEEGD